MLYGLLVERLRKTEVIGSKKEKDTNLVRGGGVSAFLALGFKWSCRCRLPANR